MSSAIDRLCGADSAVVGGALLGRAPDGLCELDEARRGHLLTVAGTGGAALRPFEAEDPNSEVRDADTHGVLRLDLRPGAYDWQFIPVQGGSFTDRGSGTCH